MAHFVIHTAETEHDGDLERYASVVRRFPETVVTSERVLDDEEEYETGELTGITALPRAELRRLLDTDEDTEGMCSIAGWRP